MADTNRKHLVSVLQVKYLSELSSHLLKMRMTVMRYDYKVFYVPAYGIIQGYQYFGERCENLYSGEFTVRNTCKAA